MSTNLLRHLDRQELVSAGAREDARNPIGAEKTPEQGAATQVWAATSPRLDRMGGVYCVDCDIAELSASDSARLTPAELAARDGVRDLHDRPRAGRPSLGALRRADRHALA